MSITFKNSPYWDDFNSSKNFHKILFKPGNAVQARELTQSQTILQDQIAKFGDHIFKNNSIVSGAECTLNLNVFFVKLNSFDNNGIEIIARDFLDKVVTNSTGSVIAKVINTAEKFVDETGTIVDPPTLIVSYLSGNKFEPSDVVNVSGTTLYGNVIASNSQYAPATGTSSTASVTEGVLYINGYFVAVLKQTVSVNEYSNAPSARVGLSIRESIIDSSLDSSLLDPALGSSNFQAPGADRYRIQLVLSVKPLPLDDDSTFIELLRIENGKLLKTVSETQYSIIDDYFAKRTFETNGDFVTNKFKLTPQSSPASNSSFTIKVGKGKAYVRGYVVENQSDFNLTVDKAREYSSVENKTISLNYGNFLICNNVTGFFDHKAYQSVDIHCSQSINTSNSLTYSTTIAATAKVKNLDYIVAEDLTNSKSYLYRMFLTDVQDNVINGTSIASSITTVTFPNYFSSSTGAYDGIYLLPTSGTNSDELVKISSYDGPTRVATLEGQFKRTPESNFTFSLIFGSKDFESIYNISTPSSNTKAFIHAASKRGGVDSGEVFFINSGEEELVYNLDNNFIVPNSIQNTAYYSWLRFKSVPLNTSLYAPGTGIMQFLGGNNGEQLSTDIINENFICVVTNPGTGHGLSIGDIYEFSGTSTNGIVLSDNGSYDNGIATLTANGLGDVVIDVFARVLVYSADNNNYVRRTKTLRSANLSSIYISGTTVSTNVKVDLTNSQVYIGKNQFNTTSQSLYISDVTKILKVIDTKNANTAPTVDMLSNPLYDVTRYYRFDDGQRDNLYDHASLNLISGAPKPQGNILVLLSYYNHTGGDGYFIGDSYLNQPYKDIPSYIGKNSGIVYNLRDAIDFRPTRKNAQASFEIIASSTVNPIIGIPLDGSLFVLDYSYYLGRKDIIIISKDKNISLVKGVPSLSPQEPKSPEGSITIGKITLEPYTMYVPGDNVYGGASSVNVEYINHKRWRMEDITTLESRVNRLEFYSSLNNLEQSAKNLQIPDEFGNNRFKNGIMTDDFSSYSIADTINSDLSCSISQTKKRLFSKVNVKNYQLRIKDVYKTWNNYDPNALAGLGYSVFFDGDTAFASLPYTKVSIASQPYATSIVNANPFFFINVEGVCRLSPHMDNWVSTERLPDMLIVNPNTQLYLQSDEINHLADWQTFSSSRRENTSVDNSLFKTATPNVNATTSGVAMDEADVIRFMNLYGAEVYLPVNGRDVALSTAITKPLISPLDSSYLTDLRLKINAFIARRFTLTGQYPGIGVNNLRTTTTTQIDTTTKGDVWGFWESLGQNYETYDGFVTDVSLNPYIRGQQVEFVAEDMLVNTNVDAYFDEVKVSNRIRQANVIEIESTIDENSNIFEKDDILAYYDSALNTYVLFGKVANQYIDFSNVSPIDAGGFVRIVQKLDIVWDVDTDTYAKDRVSSSNVFSVILTSDGDLQAVKATGNVISILRNSGKTIGQSGNNGIIIPRMYSGEYDSNRFVGSFLYQISEDYDSEFIIAGGYEDNINNTIVLYTDNTNPIMANSMIGSVYDIRSYSSSGQFKTNEYGAVSGVFYLPGNIFHTGEKIFRIDNRVSGNPGTETTFSKSTFFASSLTQQKQSLEFAPDLSSAKNTITRVDIQNKTVVTSQTTGTVETEEFSGAVGVNQDPLCQSFIVFGDEAPNGCFVKSIKLFFRKKPIYYNAPITVSILGTTNGYPNGDTLPFAISTLYPYEVRVSDTPNINDYTTYTEFEFSVPVYIKPETTYAIYIKTNSNEYELWTATLGELALSSTTGYDNIRISQTPYIGSLFLSQNATTWSADQNRDLMFDIVRCDFDINSVPTIPFILPEGLPQRRYGDNTFAAIQDPQYAANNNFGYSSNEELLVSSFNVTATDLSFDVAPIQYSYKATLASTKALEVIPTIITPGKYGTATFNDIDLGDGKGERILMPSVANSFILNATIASIDSYVSPIISESGTTVYATKWYINNLGLSNTNITILDGGISYSNSSQIVVSRTSNTSGVNALLSPVVNANGTITSINVIEPGSQYATTPTISIIDPNRSGNANAVIVISGETNSNGGNGVYRYISKPVSLAPGFDAGDLRVYLTAYRPVNTNIYVYYKLLNRNDTQQFGDSDWQLMTMISGGNLFSTSSVDLREYVAAPGRDGIADNKVIYTSKVTDTSFVNFYQFAVKIVMTSPDSTIIPYLTDARTIALPELI